MVYKLSDSSKHATGTQVSWTDVWKQDSLGKKTSQGLSSITKEMSQTDASWGRTAADPELLGKYTTPAVTNVPIMQMLLWHTAPLSKQFLSAVNVYKP